MTYEEYERICDEHAEKDELLINWENMLDTIDHFAGVVEMSSMREKDSEYYKQFFEMLWDARNFAKGHFDELYKETVAIEKKMATPEFRAMEEAERVA